MFKTINEFKKQFNSTNESIKESRLRITNNKKEFDDKWGHIGTKNLLPGKKLP